MPPARLAASFRIRCSPLEQGKFAGSQRGGSGVPVDRGHLCVLGSAGAVEDEAAGEVVAVEEGAVCDEQPDAGFEGVKADGAGAERGGQAGRGHDVSWLVRRGVMLRTLPVLAGIACLRNRLISSCWAAILDSASVLDCSRSRMAASRSASFCLSSLLCALSRVIWASRGSGAVPLARSAASRRSNSSFRCG